MPRCFCVNPGDNVATLLDDAAGGASVQVLGATLPDIVAREPIALGHKIAIQEIAAAAAIVKFGVPIGAAAGEIHVGDWVHLHNCSSSFDQRSQTLDVHTGAVTDTQYK